MNQLLQIVEQWSQMWADNLWRATLQGAIAIGVVWMIATYWRAASPRMICWAWRLVGLKLLVSLFWVQPIEVPVLPPKAIEPLVATSREPIEIAPRPLPGHAEPILSNHPVIHQVETQSASIGVLPLLMFAWLIGLCCSIALTIRECIFARRLHRPSRPTNNDSLVRLCQSEAVRFAISRIPEIRLAQLNGPMLVGIWRPAILLPENAIDQFDESELRLMLAHELAHRKRHDLAWNWLPTAVGWLLFFHPLIWLMKRSWFQSQEAACDELLIQSSVARPAEYGRLLVKVTQLWPQGEPAGVAAAGVLGAYRSLERRIVAMTRVKAISRRRLVLVASLFALVGILAIVPWRLVAQETPAAKTETTDSATTKPDTKSKKKSANKTKNPAEPSIVIAEHVLLWEGKEVVTWDEVVARFRKLRPAGPFQPDFYFTNGVSNRKQGENWDFWSDRINALYRELFEPAGVSYTSISPLNGGKFDAIRTAQDLIPDPKLARSGRVVTPQGKAAANAQVIILPTTGVNDISLNGTKLRDRFNEDWLPTDDTGEFTIHPSREEYLIVALHESGFVLEKHSADEDRLLKLDLQLQPWATVTIASNDKAAKQDVKVTAYPQGRVDRWPYFTIYEIEAKDQPVDVVVPPGAISVSRSFKMEQGTSISIPAEAFEIQPGHQHELAIAPASEAERARANELHQNLRGHIKQKNVPEAKSPADTNKDRHQDKEKPKADKASNVLEKQPRKRIENLRITVTGKATDRDGKPVANATIFLVSTNVSPDKLLGKTTTDAKGLYEFRDAELGFAVCPNDKQFIPFGSFEVFGMTPGYAFAWQQMQHVHLRNRPGVAYVGERRFVLGEPIETELRFDPPQKVSGQFVDDEGNPIAGVTVAFGDCDNSGKPDGDSSDGFWAMDQAVKLIPSLLETRSGADGRFEFSSVPPEAMCWLMISHPEYGERAIYTSTSQSPPATHDDNHPVEPLPIKMTLHKARTVSVDVKFADTNQPAAKIRVSAQQMRATGSAAHGTSDENGKLTLKLPPGEYRLTGDPIDGMDYVRSSQPLIVKPEPAEQAATLSINPACVLILKAVDADTGKGIPEVSFWYEMQGQPGARRDVSQNTWQVGDPRSDKQGELRSLAKPGKYRYGFGDLPSGYEPVAPEDAYKGRELDLPAGKTKIVEFKLRKKQ